MSLADMWQGVYLFAPSHHHGQGHSWMRLSCHRQWGLTLNVKEIEECLTTHGLHLLCLNLVRQDLLVFCSLVDFRALLHEYHKFFLFCWIKTAWNSCCGYLTFCFFCRLDYKLLEERTSGLEIITDPPILQVWKLRPRESCHTAGQRQVGSGT